MSLSCSNCSPSVARFDISCSALCDFTEQAEPVEPALRFHELFSACICVHVDYTACKCSKCVVPVVVGWLQLQGCNLTPPIVLTVLSHLKSICWSLAVGSSSHSVCVRWKVAFVNNGWVLVWWNHVLHISYICIRLCLNCIPTDWLGFLDELISDHIELRLPKYSTEAPEGPAWSAFDCSIDNSVLFRCCALELAV